MSLTVPEIPALPATWEILKRSPDGYLAAHNFTRQSVIVSEAVELDGKRWVHLSTAFPSRLPTWAELVKTKELFLGEESRALQIVAPRSEWVNIHPYCLHLFVCLDGDVTPDFTRGSGGL